MILLNKTEDGLCRVEAHLKDQAYFVYASSEGSGEVFARALLVLRDGSFKRNSNIDHLINFRIIPVSPL